MDSSVGHDNGSTGVRARAWPHARLEEVAEVSAGGSAPQGDEFFGGSNPFVRVQHLDRDRSWIRRCDLITDEAVRRYRLKLFRKGTILLPKSGASIRLEKRAILPHDAYVVSHLCTIEARDDVVDPAFLFYVLRSTRFSDSKADGYPTLGLGEIRQLRIPIPPMAEQQAIARSLGAIERAVQVAAGVCEAALSLHAAVHRQVFARGTSSSDRKMQLTEVGSVPEEWPLLRLGDLLSEPLRNGHSAPSSGSVDGVRTLTLSAVTQNDFSLRNTKVTTAAPSTVAGLWLEPGDVLVERANTRELVGTTALYDGPRHFAIYPDLIIRARVESQKVRPQFVAEFLATPGCRDYFIRNARGAAGNMPKIGHGVLERIPIPIPLLEEQDAIVAALSAVSRKARAERARQTALERLFSSALDELVGQALRGKVAA